MTDTHNEEQKSVDLEAKRVGKYTITDVDMDADDWVEQASKAVNAVKGDTYVELDRGILTVNQINALLKSLPVEITFADENNQFLYYNHNADAQDMFAKRQPEQVGSPLASGHPDQVKAHVEQMIDILRTGKQDVIHLPVRRHGADKFVVNSYQAMHDEEGNYMGVNEYVADLKPIVDWYLEQTHQKLVEDEVKPDAVSGASQHHENE
ncbi:MAG: PAS domain-containing protein [Aerococcus sp.]|nr:PAS domain-containing protein [Aerococcus sp.]